MSNSIPIATWSLGATSQTPAESALIIGPVADAIETALDDDSRTVVHPEDIRAGGKYYSIVKLQMKYEKQTSDDTRYAMGTGWLIAPDLLVTAGHCAYDHQYGFGRAIEVKAYVGYDGKESIGKAGVQFRRGVAIATTKPWIDSDINRANDVSFIRVDTPFQNVVPVKWEKTLTQGDLKLGVVGYPADQKNAKGEKGAQMYEMWAATQFDLRSAQANMLEYHISTYAGQSGSPVLVQGRPTLTSIGAHVYGLGDRNSASVIRGQYGNDYGAYISTFSKTAKFPTIASVAGVTYLKVPPQSPEADLEVEAEGFWDVFKSVVNVGTTVAPMLLQAGTPFLGPSATKIAGAVGTALSVVNQLTQPKPPGTESEFGAEPHYRSHAARAVLAEGALQSVLKMDQRTATKYGVLDRMEKTYNQNKAHIGIVARKLGPALLEPALRIAIADSAPKTGTESSLTQYPMLGDKTAITDIQDDRQRQFVQALSQASSDTVGEEGFFDFLAPLAGLATKVLPVAINGIAGLLGGGEAGFEDVAAPSDSIQAHMETLVHRSLMGEAALQAMMAVPPEQREEGFFSGLLDTVKAIGSTVIKVAPSVIKVVGPIVSSLVQESATDTSKPDTNGVRPATNGQSITKQPSIGDLARAGGIKKQRTVADMANSMGGKPKALSVTA